MTVTVANAALTLTLGAQDVSCQVINLTISPAGLGTGSRTEVACAGGIVVEPGAVEDGSLTGTVFTDPTAQGLLRMLLEAYSTGATLAYEVTLWDGTADELTMTGVAQTNAPELVWEKPALSKHNLALALKTTIVAPHGG